MRRGRLWLLCVTAWSVLTLPSGPVAGQEPGRRDLVDPRTVKQLLEGRRPLSFVPGEVIVKRKVVAGVAREVPAERLKGLRLAPEARATAGGELIYRLEPSFEATLSRKAIRERTLAAVDELKALPDVEYAQPNYILRIAATTPNDPEYGKQWHYFENGAGSGRSPGGINLPRTWDTNKGADVKVAVIDTGILPNHADIAGSPNLVQGFDMMSNTRFSNDGDGRDADPTDPGDAVSAGECGPGDPAQSDSWHGTHVAGTIGVGRTNNGAGVAGVNWNVKVQAVRVLGKCGGTIEDINDAIRWAAGLPVPGVPNNTPPAKVINMSLGGGGTCAQSPSTQRAIDDAVAAGTSVVVAAGNSADDASGYLPAGCNNVITVAASDFRGRLVTRYSNFGSTVEILAPGGDVDRDDNRDGDPDGVLSMVRGGYAYYNGTSMAAPHVAGVAALVLAVNPSASPAQVLAQLQDTAVPRSSVECPRPCGAGLLNAFAPFVSIELTPAEIRLDRGESARLTATLRRGRTLLSAESVSFNSGNPGVASVAPSTATTNASGQAQADVKGESNGNTQVRAEAQGNSKEAPVRVPSLSDAGMFILVALALWSFHRRARRRRLLRA